MKEEALPVHIGALIARERQKKGVNSLKLSRKLGYKSPSSIPKIENNQSVQLEVLWNIGIELQHNFFEDLSLAFPVRPSDTELELRIKELEKELAIYKEIVLKR